MSNQDSTGVHSVIKNSWDEVAGWHYEHVESFKTIEEAEEFIEKHQVSREMKSKPVFFDDRTEVNQ